MTKKSRMFDSYAKYYEFLYVDKNYTEEAAYVHRLIQEYTPASSSILEFGSGTGAHATELALLKYQVTGIELSAAMVEIAHRRIQEMSWSDFTAPVFINADLRRIRLEKKFDVVLALFHVMSYQTATEDLRSAIESASLHLKPGGIFLFDCWYGPAVLHQPPMVRVKRFKRDGVNITRIAEPLHKPNENVVEVRYDFFVEELSSRINFLEVHPMRYLFTPEINLLLAEYGLYHLRSEAWMSGAAPGLDTWSVCFVCGQENH